MSYARPFPLHPSLQAQEPAPPPVYAPDLAIRLICPDCRDPHPNIVEEYSSGDLVCGSCGLVLGDRIVDDRSEWRTFVDNDGDDPSRVGDAFDPFSADGNQLSTTISFKDGGSGMARKLQRAAAAGGSRKERALVEGYSEITAFCDQTSLPKSVSDTAKQLYKQLADQKMLNGRARKEIVAACIFVACRTSGVSRTFKEIAAQAGIRVKALSKCFTALKGTFDLSQATNPASLRPTKTATQPRAEPPRSTGPEVHLSRFINQLGLPPRYEFVCADIVRTACTYQDIGGRKPHTILGAAIFFTCHLLGTTIRLSEIRKVVDASDSTLKMAYRLFYDKQNALVKEEWITRGLARMDSLPPRAW